MKTLNARSAALAIKFQWVGLLSRVRTSVVYSPLLLNNERPPLCASVQRSDIVLYGNC